MTHCVKNIDPLQDSSRHTSPPQAAAEASGVLVLDKPEGLTSFAVIAKVKQWLRLKKVGHCGTLDPFATGVLVVCVNQATRIADQLSGQDKVYRFTVVLGTATDTLDRTGRVVGTYEGPARTEAEFRKAMMPFHGAYRQQVPRYAAVKIQGKRLYEWTRSGAQVDLPSREVRIFGLQLLAYSWPEAVLQVHCSKGTYIRQLAADIGSTLQCGAHVRELRRLASGPFRIEQAVTLERLAASRDGANWRERLIDVNAALAHLPAIVIEDERLLSRLSNGQLEPAWEAEQLAGLPAAGEPIRLVTGAGRLVALWWPDRLQGDTAQRRCLRVFH